MKKRTVFPLLTILVFSLACQGLFPAREGTVISDCTDIVDSISGVQPADIPQHLMDTGIKTGDEFDANKYFSVLNHVSLQEGYMLDYVYPVDFLGSSPMLYARPEDQPSYTSMEDIPENTELPDFRDHLVVDNTEQGYFEYVAMDIMAGQFYLVWHANYNDTQIVCNASEVNDIISTVNSSDFGYKLDLAQQIKARTMNNIEPLVNLTDDSATVQVVIFTKWGGFYRLTYEISRSFPYTKIDVKEENLVPYDCGVMF
jgi:hypothetical protein